METNSLKSARVDFQKFTDLLRRRQILGTRFKIDRYVEDVPRMLYECYRYQVEQRGFAMIEDEPTIDHINRTAKWLVTDTATPGLMICGMPGNGKSTLGNAVAQLINLLYDSALSTEKKVVRRIAASYLVEAARGEKNELLSELKCTELIYIDDIGTELSSVKVWGNEVSPLVDLLYHRYDKQLFTILTSNLVTREDIISRYGPRISDRFDEMFAMLKFENASYRTKVQPLPPNPMDGVVKK